MYITGKIQIEDNETTTLPESAITNDGDKFYAFTAKKEGNNWTFTPVEVFIGVKDGNWVEVKFTEELGADVKFAYNNAYYLIAEMKKGESEHSH
ncbi:putative Co/Zn/Cd efflux system membrane fusion protein [Winogradskyella psychrotolerans RS-3]|uniref:Putative Co/Zn/Cd efflux system membrane fusion protein n=1 Tax=Winogradskyella psychrotolerans RS-3 TaxID=641526 RepID=S7VVY0_9FLAO|nr:putative Co/Zn/Cd efflux system membrane fusion protein [Winogradskyella psychrotolerans RS-3]